MGGRESWRGSWVGRRAGKGPGAWLAARKGGEGFLFVYTFAV